jgi:hypothetical protein
VNKLRRYFFCVEVDCKHFVRFRIDIDFNFLLLSNFLKSFYYMFYVGLRQLFIIDKNFIDMPI